MPASFTRAQNGSNHSNAGGRCPSGVFGAAGRMHDEPRALVERPLELLHRGVDVGERDVGRGEDAVLVREAPVFFEPPVERVEHDPDAFGIVDERLLVEHTERREQPDLVDALLVHRLEARVVVAVLGADRLALAQVLHRQATRRVAAEVLRHRAGFGDRVERGVDDRVVHLAADHLVLAALDLGPLHDAPAELRVEVPGERVDRLVVVVVGVEDQAVRSGYVAHVAQGSGVM